MADQVEEVKQKTDIVSLIGEYTELKKAGRNFKANCPFHAERTPSFMVSPELQIYKCFGCGKSGDAFTFLQEHEGMDFPEALKYLADKTGIKLERTNFRSRGEKEKLYEINNLASKFYQYVLLKHPSGKRALNYLTKDRGLKFDTIRTFNIGFSPDSPSALKKFLVDKKKIDRRSLDKAALFYKRGANLYDRFRGRVIFPLHDHRGNPIGFAGRLLPRAKSEMAKYINSPETPVYIKSNVLFGLNLTRSAIKKSGRAIVVEGELDMISSWQVGIKEVVATKGTALTSEQVRLLSRFADSIVLALDADFAGDSAARRGIAIAQNEGLEVKVARIKGFKDPDEAARKDPKAYKKAIEEAVDVWKFIIDLVVSRNNPNSGTGKAKISREVAPILASVQDSIVQAHYVQYLADKLNVPVESVSDQIAKTKAEVEVKKEEATKVERKVKTRREMLEERLLTLLFGSTPKDLGKKETTKLIETSFAKRILEEFGSFTKSKKKFDVKYFAKSLPEELKEGFAEIVLKDINGLIENEEELQKELALVKKELEILNIKSILTKLAGEMKDFEKKKDQVKLKRAEKEFSKYSEKLSTLEDEVSGGIIL